MTFEDQAQEKIKELYSKFGKELLSSLQVIPQKSLVEIEEALRKELVGKPFIVPNLNNKSAFAEDPLVEEHLTIDRISFFYDSRYAPTKIIDLNIAAGQYYVKIFHDNATIFSLYFLIEFTEAIKRVIENKLHENEEYWKNILSHLDNTLSKKELEKI